MSVAASRYALDCCKRTELSPRARLVLLGLGAYANREGTAWPSVAELGAVTGLHRSNVFRALAELARVGIIDRRSGGGTRTNTYRFPLSTPVAPVRPVPVAQVHLTGRTRATHRSHVCDPEGESEGNMEETTLCDSCGEPVFDRTRFRHPTCPPPARRASAEAGA